MKDNTCCLIDCKKTARRKMYIRGEMVHSISIFAIRGGLIPNHFANCWKIYEFEDGYYGDMQHLPHDVMSNLLIELIERQ